MRIQSKTLSIGLILLVVHFTAACSPGGDSDNKKVTEQVVDEDLSAYSEASCLYCMMKASALYLRQILKSNRPISLKNTTLSY